MHPAFTPPVCETNFLPAVSYQTIQEKIKNYEQNPDKVYKILADGAAKAQQTADKTLLEVKKIVGLKK